MPSSQSVYSEYWKRPYGRSSKQLLYSRSKGCLDFIKRMKLESKLDVHNGCVNTICWNDVGTQILSGSDDQHLCITEPFTQKLQTSIQSGHLANIFSAKFLPCTQNNQVISCSGDGMIYYTMIDRPDQYAQHAFSCHFGTTYEIVTVPEDRNTFLSCGEDASVRWFDLRIKDKCNKEDCKEDILINCRRAVTSLAINPCKPYQLSVGCSDSSVRIFDRRMLGTRATGNYTGRSSLTGMVCRFTPPLLEQRSHRITSLCYSSDGSEVLASYSSEKIYLFNICGQQTKDFDTNATPITASEKSGPAEGSGRHPPIKRLRLRGDWSDTGPNARPEGERGQPVQPSTSGVQAEAPPEDPSAERENRSMTIMQRMSDMLTRWLEGASRTAEQRSQPPEGSAGDDSVAQGEAAATDERSSQDEGVSNTVPNSQNAPIVTTQPTEPSGESQAVIPDKSDEVDTPHTDSHDTSERKGLGHDESQNDKVSNDGAGKPDSGICREVQSADTTKSVEISKESRRQEGNKGNGNDPKDASTSSSHEKTNLAQACVMAPEGNAGECREKVSVSTGIKNIEKSSNVFEKDHPSAIPATSVIDKTRQKSDEILKSECESCHTGSERTGKDTTSPCPSRTPCALQTQSKIDPVVSLHYTSEGTSSGVIKLDYPASGTRQGPNLPPSVSDYSETHPVQSGRTEHCPKPSQETAKLSLTHSPQSVSFTIREENRDDKDTSSDQADAPAEKSALCAEARLTNTGESGTPKVTAEETSHTEHAKLRRSLSDTVKDSSPTTPPSDDLEVLSADESFAAAAAVKTIKYNPHDDPDDSQSSEDEAPRRLPSESRPGPSGVAGPAGGRQRRHGHSLPPTGNFQLFSGSDDSNDDDDDEPDDLSSSKDRDEMERNLAALRLQELYRKRQAEREKEDRLFMNIYQPGLKYVYAGHRNARTMIKEAAFWGEDYIMSGSDCGHIFVWDRHTSELVMLQEADKHVVNCLQPHPTDPVLATSGIDYDIKLWMPTAKEPFFDSEKAEEVVRRNQLMLEETRDTITVPASFMLRMLASLNHIRSGRRQGNGDSSSSSSEEE